MQISKLENIKLPVGKFNDENSYNKHVVGKPAGKADSKIVPDEYKPFFVYEDPQSSIDNPEDKENANECASSSSVVAIGGAR